MKEIRIPFKKYEDKTINKLNQDIIDEKLSEGINGVEWLLLHTRTDEETKEYQQIWHEKIKNSKGGASVERLMIDNLLLSPREFYMKYEINWWASLEHTIYELQMMRENDYDSYFEWMRRYERMGE